MDKRSIDNPDKRAGAYFSWGLELTGVERVLFVTGTTAAGADGEMRHEGDASGQAHWIFDSVGRVLDRAGYAWADVVRVETTVVERLTDEEIAAIGRIAAERFAAVPVKPAAGTLRVVSRLMRPGMLVELEFLAAK